MARKPDPKSRTTGESEAAEGVEQAEAAAAEDMVGDAQTLAEEELAETEASQDAQQLPTASTVLEKAASFNQAQLTAQAGEVMGALENPVADQAAVMMLEDLRGFMQGSEQLVLAASGQAMAMLLDPATQETAKTALQELATWQGNLTEFATNVTDNASTIKGDFSS